MLLGFLALQFIEHTLHEILLMLALHERDLVALANFHLGFLDQFLDHSFIRVFLVLRKSEVIDLISDIVQRFIISVAEAAGEVCILIFLVRISLGTFDLLGRFFPQRAILRFQVCGDLIRRLDEIEERGAVLRRLVENRLIGAQLRQLILGEVALCHRGVSEAFLEKLGRVHLHRELVVDANQLRAGSGQLSRRLLRHQRHKRVDARVLAEAFEQEVPVAFVLDLFRILEASEFLTGKFFAGVVAVHLEDMVIEALVLFGLSRVRKRVAGDLRWFGDHLHDVALWLLSSQGRFGAGVQAVRDGLPFESGFLVRLSSL